MSTSADIVSVQTSDRDGRLAAIEVAVVLTRWCAGVALDEHVGALIGELAGRFRRPGQRRCSFAI
jgi:hypothetical protein